MIMQKIHLLAKNLINKLLRIFLVPSALTLLIIHNESASMQKTHDEEQTLKIAATKRYFSKWLSRTEEAWREFRQDPLVLHKACESHDIKKVKQLLLLLKNPDIHDKNWQTPLHKAVCQSKKSPALTIEIMQLLLDHGASINAQDTCGDTPLQIAIIDGPVEIVKFLLNNKASVETKDKLGRTPLHWCAANGKLAIAQLLVGKGASFMSQSEIGNTPIHHAINMNTNALALLKAMIWWRIPFWWQPEQDVGLNKVASLQNMCLNFLASDKLMDRALPIVQAELKEKLENRRIAYLHSIFTIRNKHNKTAREVAISNGRLSVIRFIDKMLQATSLQDLEKLSPKPINRTT